MKKSKRLAGLLFGLSFSGSLLAMDCSLQVNEATTAVNGAAEVLKAMPDGALKKEVHMLLDDAKMYLMGAQHNMDKPQGDLDIARCMGKAGAAVGFAQAAKALAASK